MDDVGQVDDLGWGEKAHLLPLDFGQWHVAAGRLRQVAGVHRRRQDLAEQLVGLDDGGGRKPLSGQFGDPRSNLKLPDRSQRHVAEPGKGVQAQEGLVTGPRRWSQVGRGRPPGGEPAREADTAEPRIGPQAACLAVLHLCEPSLGVGLAVEALRVDGA
jgi:hypothetical protein